MGFLDNIIREGTKGVLGHVSGKRLGEAEARRRLIEDRELALKTDRDAVAATLSKARLEEFKSDRDRRATERASAEAKLIEDQERAAEEVSAILALRTDLEHDAVAALDATGRRQVLTAAMRPPGDDAGPTNAEVRQEARATAQGEAQGLNIEDPTTSRTAAIIRMKEKFPSLSEEIVSQMVEEAFDSEERERRTGASQDEGSLLGFEDAIAGSNRVHTIDEDRPADFNDLLSAPTTREQIASGDLPAPGSTTPPGDVELPPDPPALSAEAQEMIDALGSAEAAIQAISAAPGFADDEQAKAVVRELTLATGG